MENNNETKKVKLTEDDIINLAAIGNAGDEGYNIKSIGYKPYVSGFNSGANWYKKGIKKEYDKLKEDNSLLLESLKGLVDILNKAANSLESQARREHLFNTLVEPLREYSEAIKKAESK